MSSNAPFSAQMLVEDLNAADVDNAGALMKRSMGKTQLKVTRRVALHQPTHHCSCGCCCDRW